MREGVSNCTIASVAGILLYLGYPSHPPTRPRMMQIIVTPGAPGVLLRVAGVVRLINWSGKAVLRRYLA